MIRIAMVSILMAVAGLALAQSSAERLGPGDAVRVTVFQQPDLTTEARVSERGTIDMPLVGVVKIAGQSTAEAGKTIAEALKHGEYLKAPQVTVTLTTVRSRQVSVLGMIARPLDQILAHATTSLDDITFVLHTDGRSVNEPTIRAALARANANLAAYNFLSLQDAAARSRTTERFIFVLVSSFGIVGLVLAAVGLYGLLALQVARREREFGIRSALGATARQIIQLVARQGATLLSLGFTAGALATYGVVGLVRNQWAEMPAPNLIACISAAVVLGIAVILACWLPARRASRVDPVIALRAE